MDQIKVGDKVTMRLETGCNHGYYQYEDFVYERDNQLVGEVLKVYDAEEFATVKFSDGVTHIAIRTASLIVRTRMDDRPADDDQMIRIEAGKFQPYGSYIYKYRAYIVGRPSKSGYGDTIENALSNLGAKMKDLS